MGPPRHDQPLGLPDRKLDTSNRRDAGARDTFTSRHPSRVPESRPHRAVVPRVDYHRPW